MKILLSLILVLVLTVAGNAAYYGDIGKSAADGSITYVKLNADVTSVFTNTTEVNSLFDTRFATKKLEDLDSVEITTPANDEVIKWNGTSHVWENGSLAGVGDMLKSVYDTVDDGTVNSARALDADYLGDGLAYDGNSLEVQVSAGLKFTTGALDFDLGKGLWIDTTDSNKLSARLGAGLQFGAAPNSIEIKLDTASGLAVSVDGLKINADGIKDTMIDWGTGATQISGADVPLADAGSYYPTDEVESALQYAGSVMAAALTVDKISRTIEVFTTDSADDVLTLAHDPIWTPVVYWGRSVVQQPEVDYTYDLEAGTVTIVGGTADVAVAISYEYVTP